MHDKAIIDSDVDDFELAKRLELRQRFDLKNPAAIIKVSNSLDEWIKENYLDSPESDESKFSHFGGPRE